MKARITGWALAVMMGMASSAYGQTGPREGARAWIEHRHAAVNQLLGQPASAERNARVARVLDAMLDLNELARRALEPAWTQRTEAERTEFVDLLRQLIDRNYQQNLERTLNFTVSYDPETVDAASGDATVHTVARSRTDARAAPVTVEYRLHPRDRGWVVYDIVTNGASLVQSYHDSYMRIIRDHGFPELLTRMRNRIAQMASGPDGGTAGP